MQQILGTKLRDDPLIISLIYHPHISVALLLNRDIEIRHYLKPFNTHPTKWSNTLTVFDHFMGLALKGLTPCVHQKVINTSHSFKGNNLTFFVYFGLFFPLKASYTTSLFF